MWYPISNRKLILIIEASALLCLKNSNITSWSVQLIPYGFKVFSKMFDEFWDLSVVLFIFLCEDFASINLRYIWPPRKLNDFSWLVFHLVLDNFLHSLQYKHNLHLYCFTCFRLLADFWFAAMCLYKHFKIALICKFFQNFWKFLCSFSIFVSYYKINDCFD